MSLDERVSRVIRGIYTGMLDPTQWSAALDDLVGLTGTRWAFASVTDTSKGEADQIRYERIGWHGAAADSSFALGMDELVNGTVGLDPSVEWIFRNPNAGFCDSRAAIGPDRYIEDPFVRWSNTRFGTTHWFIGYTPPGNGTVFALSLHSNEPLSSTQKQLFKLVYGHAENAAQLYARAPWGVPTDKPCLLVARNGMVQWMSAEAEILLAQNRGLTASRRKLSARDPDADHRLQAAIASAAAAFERGGIGGAVSVPSSRSRDLIAIVRPAPHPPSFADALGPAVLVTLIDPGARVPKSREALWRQLFKLTKAEAQLAAALMSAENGLKEAALSLRIAHTTARVHLSRIFDKTGTHSQGQSIRLLSQVGSIGFVEPIP